VIQCLAPSAVTSLGSPVRLIDAWQQGALGARSSELQKLGRDGATRRVFFGQSVKAGQCSECRRNPLALIGYPPPFPKDGRIRLIDFPIEKIVIAGPRMDLDPANLADETAIMLVRMMFPCRGVRQPATGAAKIFDGPSVACHPAIMRSIKRVFQLRGLR
jgi:hypothetical protein